MKAAVRYTHDWFRGIFILVGALLLHLLAFLTFRNHIVWPSPPPDTVDFIGFKLPPPPPHVPLPPISPVSMSPPVDVVEPTKPKFTVPTPSDSPFVVPGGGAMIAGRTSSFDVYPEETGYFAVPSTAEGNSSVFILGHAFSNTGGTQPFILNHFAGSGQMMMNFGPHVRFSDFRKTQPR